MKYLLDTNVLLHLANRVTGFRRIVKRIDRLDSPEDVAISAITAHEVHYQLLKAKVSKERLAALAYYLAQWKTDCGLDAGPAALIRPQAAACSASGSETNGVRP